MKKDDERLVENGGEEKDYKAEKKSEVIEHVIILALSVVLFLVGALLKNETAQRWLYTFSFVTAGYEVLYSAIIKLSKKEVIIEEIAVVLSLLVLLYDGYGECSCIIAVIYSAIALYQKIFAYIAIARSENVSFAADCETDEEIKKYLRLRSENLKLFADELDCSKPEEKKFKIVCGIVGIALGLLVAFVPPIFIKGDYGTHLTDKWLVCGAILIALWQLSALFASSFACYLSATVAGDGRGIIFGSFNAVDCVADKNEVVFDCSGVITEKDVKILSVESQNIAETLSIAIEAESETDERFRSALAFYAKELKIDLPKIELSDVNFIESAGITLRYNAKKYVVGSKKLVKSEFGLSIECNEENPVIFVAEEKGCVGKISYKHIEKANVSGEFAELSDGVGVTTTIISSGLVSSVNALKRNVGADKAIAGASIAYKADYVKNAAALYVGDEKYDRGAIRALNGECVTVGGAKSYENGVTIDGNDVRQVPVTVKIAKRSVKLRKFITRINLGLKLAAIIGGVALFAFTGKFLWLPILLCAIADAVSLGCTAINLSDPS